jgi:uncharacterized membrane protein
MPADLDILHSAAIALIFMLWTGYGPILNTFGHGTLNAQLHGVRLTWMRNMIKAQRENRVVDGLMLGHLSGQMSFFGSATLIVLAGLVGTLAGIGRVHAALNEMPFFPKTSLELFTIHFATLTLIMAFAFFSFTYALRKLAYTFAMIGGLPETHSKDEYSQDMVDQTTTVLTESVKSLNNGIRGYYFAIASLFLFVGPVVSIIVTICVALILYWRQGLSTVALAIERYVEAMNKREERKP